MHVEQKVSLTDRLRQVNVYQVYVWPTRYVAFWHFLDCIQHMFRSRHHRLFVQALKSVTSFILQRKYADLLPGLGGLA